jgi:nucleoside diphosphate kinase
MGTIRASYQIDLNDELIQRITGVELDFNNLATFSASYKLLDPENIESTLKSQTAWDLGLGVTLNENYGLNLGYELIETEDESEESERNISASFEINF